MGKQKTNLLFVIIVTCFNLPLQLSYSAGDCDNRDAGKNNYACETAEATKDL